VLHLFIEYINVRYTRTVSEVGVAVSHSWNYPGKDNMASVQGNKAKRWVFTLNNYTELDCAHFETMEADYLIFGKEVGDSGTPHLQGYVELKTRKRMTELKKLFSGNTSQRTHWDIALGDGESNRVYCSKSNDFFEKGVMMATKKGGAKANKLGEKLDALKAAIDEGKNLRDCFDQDFGTAVRYHSGLAKYHSMISLGDRGKPRVEVLIGTTGVGKTRYVHDFAKWFHEGEIYVHGDSPKFFDGYCGQECVLFDDFRGDIPFAYMLRLLDRYAMRVQVKGGSVSWRPTRIFITSNVKPNAWYPHDELAPLLRRLDRVYELTESVYD